MEVIPLLLLVVALTCVVCSCADLFGRSQALWGPDAEQFKPERWLQMSEAPSQYKFIAFNAGYRLCLGKLFTSRSFVLLACACSLLSAYMLLLSIVLLLLHVSQANRWPS